MCGLEAVVSGFNPRAGQSSLFGKPNATKLSAQLSRTVNSIKHFLGLLEATFHDTTFVTNKNCATSDLLALLPNHIISHYEKVGFF